MASTLRDRVRKLKAKKAGENHLNAVDSAARQAARARQLEARAKRPEWPEEKQAEY
jgi:hypothetical protein